MRNINIFTEEPEQDLWRMILQYAYSANIQKYYDDHSIAVGNDFEDLASSIAGAITQADEYYKASKIASLHVQPLLLYYGTTNLLYAMCLLINGKTCNIDNHGMRIINVSKPSFIADVQVKFEKYKSGGLQYYADNLGFKVNLCSYNYSWSLGDFLGSIAEISDDYNRCYANKVSNILMIDTINTADGEVEKLNVEEDIEKLVSCIDGFCDAYLPPMRGESESCYVLRHKMNGPFISQVSFSGQKYLRKGHSIGKQLITIPEELNIYISLFVLGSLCRYYPRIWHPFVTQDSTGEKLLIEKALFYSRRILPNIVLNRIIGDQITFVSSRYSPENRIHLVGEHEVKEIVNEEVEKQIKLNHMNNTIHIRR